MKMQGVAIIPLAQYPRHTHYLEIFGKIQVTATDTYGSDTVAEIVFPVLEEPPEEFVTITRHVNISCIVLDDEGTYMLREAAAQLNLTDQGVNISVYGF